MIELVESMLHRLGRSSEAELIAWAAPVPSFGCLPRASVATLGINPSNREFVDESGQELTGDQRRFHTLRSLSLDKWSDADPEDIVSIIDSCVDYFFRNPYNGWFKRLDAIIAGTGRSYYDHLFPACHIDLLPFATDAKWATLASDRRNQLLRANADLLRAVIKASSLDLLILNGQCVVTEFQAITGAQLASRQMSSWSLPRSSGNNVMGVAYTGGLKAIGGVPLPKRIKVLGFNHNIQSSFGVTSAVMKNIAEWIGKNSQLCQANADTGQTTREKARRCA